MATFTAMTAIAVAAAYDFSQFGDDRRRRRRQRRAADRHPAREPEAARHRLRPPHAVETARGATSPPPASRDRCSASAADFFESVPERRRRLYRQARHPRLGRREGRGDPARTAAAPWAAPAKLLIVEGVYPQRIDASLESRGAAANDVNMLVCTGGRQRSEAEFARLYASAGFRLTPSFPHPRTSPSSRALILKQRRDPYLPVGGRPTSRKARDEEAARIVRGSPSKPGRTREVPTPVP